ncbi:hypothetical protein [Sphingobacterium paucimobilis]|uniref:Uncharacterized protein n=1 Tax=Sphingobacterium paucimobilis HER1398 TaxID=1346330 RepID=U2J609_9SPHI|nr:hypothetical protein [Sphingobacterium paucimobilis]ERJ60374.1 hypothetical protein M472_16605 [Sphingobacterium paucimobilis HER1398]
MFRFFKELFKAGKTEVKKEEGTKKKNNDPDNVLSEIVWTFNRKPYDSQIDFDGEIARYQKDILKSKAHWNGDDIAIHASEIEITYEAWISDLDDLRSNEELLEAEEDVFDEDNEEDGLFQVEISARLHAANGMHFTALDLLYQMEHQVSNKELGDHIFFEGFRRVQDYERPFPLYYMICGS